MSVISYNAYILILTFNIIMNISERKKELIKVLL